MEKKWGIFIKLGLKAAENKGWRIREAITMDRGQYEESVSFIKECAKGATVDDGLFSKDNTEIQNYINEKVLK